MRRLTCLLLAIILLFSLTACGGSSPAASGSPAQSQGDVSAAPSETPAAEPAPEPEPAPQPEEGGGDPGEETT